MFRKVKPYFPPSNIFLLKALILSTIVISICQAQYAKAALVEIKIVDPVREVKLGETALFDAIITNKTSKSVKVTADFDPTNAVLGVLGSGSFISGMEISHNAQWQGSFFICIS